jgi:hypothetical protein
MYYILIMLDETLDKHQVAHILSGGDLKSFQKPLSISS